MWKYASILILAILISSLVHAQKTLSVSKVNMETYALYQKQEWKQLIMVGENSIKQGIDFYLLRLRMGIAYYELEKYRKSAVLFKDLYRQNPEDASVKEYLYFSYLLGGRSMDARRLQNDLAQSIRDKYDIDKIKLISGIYAETKYEFLDDYAIDSDQIQQQTVRNQFHHYSVGLNHQLGKRTEILHAYSRVDLKNSIVSEGFHFNEKVKQNQYYLKSSFQIDWGTELALAGHWVQTKVKGYQLNANGDGRNGAVGSALEIAPYAISQNSFVGYLGLHQELSNWKVNLGLLYSNMDDLTRWQQEVSVHFYPQGNLKFYLLASFTNQLEEKLERGWLNRRYWKGGAGFQLAKNTWAQVGYSFGDMFKHVENEGYSVFNGVNLIKNKKEISLYQYLVKGKLNLFLLYQNQKERNGYIINDKINRQDINVQSITGGITWNF
ncbi:hypothetical protein DWB61_15180 [Ancylomarina euxinus]|uniref:Tetratricopeptide repeat protein n=1 Tax=Ancylomarina euxinus TaxID=2283627 RepID=A0A425XXV6_9BACT|nr:tetratricopeptide repeat protein [Ancylomarina euxinus]MCZ4696058.1 tetratricopeptide repeat protein [Ancylomarina euxinus]MUP13997.1 hypothetical protein [Ancylomarina euxinus]RRG19552.1 hypothetical protein DWB61_15180 [Ancylomarina euxinus]